MQNLRGVDAAGTDEEGQSARHVHRRGRIHRCSGGKERMGALERGVSALHQAGTGKCLSGNQASGGMDFGDISQEKTTNLNIA